MKNLGAEPVTLDTADVPQAAQRGTVNCIITAATTILGNKWYEFIQYGYTMDIAIGGPSYILMNNKAYEALPADVQKILREDAQKTQDLMMQNVLGSEDDAINELAEKYGIKIYQPSDQDYATARAKIEPYYVQWAQQQGGDMPKALADAEAALK